MTDRQLFYFLWCLLLYVVGTLFYFSLTMPIAMLHLVIALGAVVFVWDVFAKGK